MKTGLIFDMDGTLWDSAENVAKSWTEAVKNAGYNRASITTEDIMGVMGLTMDVIADRLFADLDKDERMKLLDICCVNENAYLLENGGVLYPELEKTLIELKKNYNLYIVSNCQQGYIEAFLEHYSFGKYFEDIECYGNNLKSKGENIALLAKRNNLEKAFYIGDIQGDYDATMQAASILKAEGLAELSFIHAAYGFGTVDANVTRIHEFKELLTICK